MKTISGYSPSERLPVFENRLRDLMREQGWKCRTLASTLHVETSTISVWRVGHARPSLSRLMQLARVLGVDPNYLMGWSDKRPDQQLAKVATRLERALVEVRAELETVKRRRKAGAL